MNIEDKTIFDFCDDKEVLTFITPLSQSQYIKDCDKSQIFFDLSMLAFITGNEGLNEALFLIEPAIIEWENDVFNFAEKYQQKHNNAR